MAKVPVAFMLSTIAISILVTVVSGMGIFVGSTYARETSDWAVQARAQDIADVLAVAILLASVYFAGKGSVRGLLLWVGTLLFLIYAFFIYAFALHFNGMFLVYVVTLGLCVYTFLGGALRLDFQALKKHFAGVRARTATSALLVLLALVFYALWLSEDVPAILTGTVPGGLAGTGLLTNPVHVLDLGLYLPAFIITGVSLWRRGALGSFFAAPILVFGALTGMGILMIDLLSSASGISTDLGQEVFVSLIVLVSTVFAAVNLSGVREDRPQA